MGRTEMRSLGALGSTIHSMIKFPTVRGVATMRTSKEALWECRQIERMQSLWKETHWRHHMEQMSKIREQAILRARSIPNQRPRKEPMVTEETWDKDTVKEKVIIHNDRPDQHILINEKLSIGLQVLFTAPQGTQPNANIGKRQRKDGIPYRGGSILFHPHAKGTKKFCSHTPKNDRQDAWSETENKSCLIRLKEGSRGASGEKIFGQEEQVLHMSDRNKEEASRSREKPQEELIPTPRAWRLYVGKKQAMRVLT
ncbi:hypothetical protein Tco_0475088 [Tanacetum coccineum]